MLRVIRQTGNGPSPMHSGPQGKSELSVRLNECIVNVTKERGSCEREERKKERVAEKEMEMRRGRDRDEEREMKD